MLTKVTVSVYIFGNEHKTAQQKGDRAPFRNHLVLGSGKAVGSLSR